MDPVALAAELGAQLVTYIAQAIADGAKSEREAKRIALQRLVDEHPLEPVLDDVQRQIADARRPAVERDHAARVERSDEPTVELPLPASGKP